VCHGSSTRIGNPLQRRCWRRREYARENEWTDYGSDIAVADGEGLSPDPLLLMPIPWTTAFLSMPCPVLQQRIIILQYRRDRHPLLRHCCPRPWIKRPFKGISEEDLRVCSEITQALLGAPCRFIFATLDMMLDSISVCRGLSFAERTFASVVARAVVASPT